MSLRLEHLDRTCWHELAPGFDDYSYRQAWDFGVACAQRLGACSEHIAVTDGEDVLALADVRIKRVPVLGSGIAYVNGGPLVRKGPAFDPDRLRASLETLRDEYARDRGLVLRILPPIDPPERARARCDVYAGLGFGSAEQPPPYRTMLVSLEPPLEQIRKDLAQKWRNGLNRSQRNGLEVRSGTDSELFEQFGHLFADLLDRKGFDVDLHADFYARVQQDLPEAHRFLVSIVDVDGEPAAGHVASILGDTCVYILGASNDQGMRSKASYLLQWHTIETARSRGCRWYDLGGIDPQGNRGVYHFKKGLGGIDVTAAGPFEFAPGGMSHRIVRGCERMYRSVQRLRRNERHEAAST